MGWERGDADPIEVELVEVELLEDELLKDKLLDDDLIGGGSARRSRFARVVPRSLRTFGTVAAAAVLAVALWPAPKTRPQAAPSTTESQTQNQTQEPEPAPKTVDADLYKACGVLRTTPVLPVTVRYSVSTPDDLTISHNYEYPLAPAAWAAFMQARAGLCTGPAGGVFAVSAQIEPPARGERDSTDLVLTMDSVGRPGWALEKLTAAVPGITITTADLPAALELGKTSAVRTHWHFDALGAGCMPPPPGSDGLSAIQLTTRPGGAPADGSGDQQLAVYLRPELMARMAEASCPAQSRTGPR